MMRALARLFWNRRHRITLGVKRAGSYGVRLGRAVPMPQRVRMALLDVFFLSIEHMVLNTNLHRSWQKNRAGTERLHRLMKPVGAEEKGCPPLSPPRRARRCSKRCRSNRAAPGRWRMTR